MDGENILFYALIGFVISLVAELGFDFYLNSTGVFLGMVIGGFLLMIFERKQWEMIKND